MANDFTQKSELESLIPPEIKNDEFYRTIQDIARSEAIATVLEIGSSSGRGSTEAFVTGLRQNPYRPTLFCMEVSKSRFAALQQHYSNDDFVQCYNVSSVALSQFPEEQEVIDFYQNIPTNLNIYPLENVIGWLRRDIDYVKSSGVPDQGIQRIKQEHQIDCFDVVLIDGSEFTGAIELEEVYGAKFILLDDIRTFKNYHNHQRLSNDPNYVLTYHNPYVRHGYSVFRKTDLPLPPRPKPLIVIDGVFFQRYKTGIARVWKSLLQEWAETEFRHHLVVLDRAGTAPEIAGIRYVSIASHDENAPDADRAMLQQTCDQLEADLFISTYFTTPLTTPSVLLVYDMILEVVRESSNHPTVRDKRQAVQHASDYLAISQNTARDLEKFFPEGLNNTVKVAYCGVESSFFPADAVAIAQFKAKYGITKPYFLLMRVDNPSRYKNNRLFFQAFSQLDSKTGFDLVCTAFLTALPDDLRACTTGCTVHLLRLSDAELAVAYSGAIALVYPSQYEGFGLPILEAMACGCPVITCANASIPEVAGEAALYVADDQADELAEALCEVQKPAVRAALRDAGLTQAQQFSWTTMAETIRSVLVEATLPCKLRQINLLLLPDWSQPEAMLYEQFQTTIAALVNYPDPSLIVLLVEVSQVPEQLDPAMLLGDVVMNLLMSEAIDDEPELALVSDLSPIQWQTLAPQITGYVALEETADAIETMKAYNIKPLVMPDLISER
jgi:glycosyltransferase involved in cell wall biosynthesis